MQRELHFIFKNLYEFKGFGGNILVKEFATKDRRPLLMIFETYERPTAAASECGLVCRTADSCQ